MLILVDYDDIKLDDFEVDNPHSDEVINPEASPSSSDDHEQVLEIVPIVPLALNTTAPSKLPSLATLRTPSWSATGTITCAMITVRTTGLNMKTWTRKKPT
ncbi:Uu.00g052870.m01.CDS01 [Anthostomella pinea]|uniref:Uu.00g052870.m01.CDS01 n=1 Tax=Anthostomella pinea TaxID=933095 RepID=A0AAI8YM30_9PEZI|nr:Uu.00g052870.m01.CDS01 [Anthostomella pinea]